MTKNNNNNNNSNGNATNDNENDTFSAIIESTRIQSKTYNDPLDDNEMTLVSMAQQQQNNINNAIESSSTSTVTTTTTAITVGGGRRSSLKRSRQISDLDEPPQVILNNDDDHRHSDDPDQSSNLIACLNDLEVGGPRVRVLLAPHHFNMGEFVCYKAELQASFERLQNAMNIHYEKISRASKSLESDVPPAPSAQIESKLGWL